jgi:hypothetical protein
MKVKKLFEVLLFVAKIVSFLSLVMSVVIKTRILLGIHNTIAKNEEKDEN